MSKRLPAGVDRPGMSSPHPTPARSAPRHHAPGEAAGRRGSGLPARHLRPAWSSLAGWLLSALIVVALLLCWQGAIWVWHLESYVLPTPRQVLGAFGQADTRALILNNLGPTVTEAALGFLLSLLVGTGLAVVMFASRVARDGLYPLLIASQAVPTIAIGAVLVVALGYGPAPKVVVVVLYSFFAVSVNVYESLRSLDPDMPALLRTLGASRLQVLRAARIPAALPGFFTGAKLAVTFSVSGAIYGEWVGATGGLGYALQMAANQNASATVLAIVLVMALLGVAAFAAVALLERLLLPWHQPGSDH
jgi:ABC-type nitrate/sulfonate/bicarbonate transport system permease component